MGACAARPIILALLGAMGAGLAPSGATAATAPAQKSMYLRDLNCPAVTDARAGVICRGLQREMEWTWFGHAIVSPGWRVTFGTVVRTYCGEQIGSADIAPLERLRRSSGDWRAESGADFLLRLVRTMDGSAHEEANSIFNRRNPSFILKGGCPPA